MLKMTAVWAEMAVTILLAPLAIVFFAVFIHQKTDEISLSALDQTHPARGNEFSYPSSLIRVNDEAFITSYGRQRRSTLFAKPTSCILLNLLLLCGDISLNPGPNWKFPCSLCKGPVKSNQRGIQCDSCDFWFHSRCLGMNNDEYQQLANSSCSWICPNCDLPNFSTSLCDWSTNSSILSNSFDILSDNVVENITINNLPRNHLQATSAPKHNKKTKLKPNGELLAV